MILISSLLDCLAFLEWNVKLSGRHHHSCLGNAIYSLLTLELVWRDGVQMWSFITVDPQILTDFNLCVGQGKAYPGPLMFADITLCMTGLENRFYTDWLQLRLQEMQLPFQETTFTDQIVNGLAYM